jgi:hypothetical protein
MSEKQHTNNMKKGISLVALLLLVSFVLLLGGCDWFGDNSKKDDENQGSVSEAADTDTEDTDADDAGDDSSDDVDIRAEADEAFANYMISVLKEMAPTDTLLWSTTGYINAERVTIEEIEANAESYKEIIISNLGNSEVIFDISEEGGTITYTFNPEKLLNLLGMGTHMGNGLQSVMEITVNEELGGVFQATFIYQKDN